MCPSSLSSLNDKRLRDDNVMEVKEGLIAVMGLKEI